MSKGDTLDTNAGRETKRFWGSDWFDEGLEVPKDLSIEVITKTERDRITKALSVVLYAASIPRRLGGEASSKDLALDKKRCRRVAYALRQSLYGWDKKSTVKPLNSDEIKQLGAQIDWEKFLAEHLVAIQSRARVTITWAVLTEQDRWGKSAATNYINEQRWLIYSMRE